MPKGKGGRPRGKKCVDYPNLREPDYCDNCKNDARLLREHKRPRGRKCTKEHPADGGGYPAVSAAAGHGGGAGSGAQVSPPPSAAASPIASRLKDRGAQRVSESLGGLKYSPQQAPRSYVVDANNAKGSRRKGLKRLELDQILFLDEKHFKVILGCLSKYEYLAPLNPDAPQSEWKYPEWKDQTSVKHAKEAHVAG